MGENNSPLRLLSHKHTCTKLLRATAHRLNAWQTRWLSHAGLLWSLNDTVISSGTAKLWDDWKKQGHKAWLRPLRVSLTGNPEVAHLWTPVPEIANFSCETVPTYTLLNSDCSTLIKGGHFFSFRSSFSLKTFISLACCNDAHLFVRLELKRTSD